MVKNYKVCSLASPDHRYITHLWPDPPTTSQGLVDKYSHVVGGGAILLLQCSTVQYSDGSEGSVMVILVPVNWSMTTTHKDKFTGPIGPMVKDVQDQNYWGPIFP